MKKSNDIIGRRHACVEGSKFKVILSFNLKKKTSAAEVLCKCKLMEPVWNRRQKSTIKEPKLRLKRVTPARFTVE